MNFMLKWQKLMFFIPPSSIFMNFMIFIPTVNPAIPEQDSSGKRKNGEIVHV